MYGGFTWLDPAALLFYRKKLGKKPRELRSVPQKSELGFPPGTILLKSAKDHCLRSVRGLHLARPRRPAVFIGRSFAKNLGSFALFHINMSLAFPLGLFC